MHATSPATNNGIPGEKRTRGPTTGGPYPPTAGPYPPTAGPYPPTAGPYPPTAGPYPPTAGPYPPKSARYLCRPFTIQRANGKEKARFMYYVR